MVTLVSIKEFFKYRIFRCQRERDLTGDLHPGDPVQVSDPEKFYLEGIFVSRYPTGGKICIYVPESDRMYYLSEDLTIISRPSLPRDNIKKLIESQLLQLILKEKQIENKENEIRIKEIKKK